MGVSRLEQNVAALIEAGKSPQTPAAMVEKGGWPEQRMISATLADIAEKARESKIESPAILVVGEVVLLAEKLGQKKIAILRPAAQQKESAALAESYGFSPILAPAIALAEKPLPDDLVERLCRAECVAFTSANGVKMALHSPAIRKTLEEKTIVAIGPKTAQALAEQGLTAQVPEEYSSEGMEKMLRGKCKSILFLRSAQGSQYLSEGLKAAGLYVDDIALYEVVPSGDARLDELIKRAKSVDIFAFTSSSTARYLIERAKAMGQEKQLREALVSGTVAAIGKPTAEQLASLGVEVDVMPDKFTFEAMLSILQEKKR
jgi:uroporphyrinogen III methyltransferase/synthase